MHREKKSSKKSVAELEKGRRERREYSRVKKEYKELCDRKKEDERERWEREAKEARTEGQVWEVRLSEGHQSMCQPHLHVVRVSNVEIPPRRLTRL